MDPPQTITMNAMYGVLRTLNTTTCPRLPGISVPLLVKYCRAWLMLTEVPGSIAKLQPTVILMGIKLNQYENLKVLSASGSSPTGLQGAPLVKLVLFSIPKFAAS